MGESGSPPAAFEQYILALTWQPIGSLSSCPMTGNEPSASLVAATNALPTSHHALQALSLHGLWPEYRDHRSHAWPEYCDRPEFNYSECTPRRSRITQSPVEEIGTPCTTIEASVVEEFNVSDGWQSYALSYAFRHGAAAHEWARHGSCTGFSQRSYFARAARLVASLELSLGNRLLRRSVASGSCSASMLRAAWEEDVGAAPVLRCARGCVLSGLWLGVQAQPGRLVPVIDPEHGVTLNSSSIGPDTCASCESLVLWKWKGCPPGPPAPPEAPPLPPGQPWHTASLGAAGAGFAVTTRAVAIVLAVGLLATLGVVHLRRARKAWAGIHALPGATGSDPPSPVRIDLPMPPADGSSASLRHGGSIPLTASPSRAANVTLTRLVHDDGDEIID